MRGAEIRSGEGGERSLGKRWQCGEEGDRKSEGRKGMISLKEHQGRFPWKWVLAGRQYR